MCTKYASWDSHSWYWKWEALTLTFNVIWPFRLTKRHSTLLLYTNLGWPRGPTRPKRALVNKIWWLCLVPTSTTRFASEVGYRIAKIWHGYTRKIFFMNNDIEFLNRERRTRYSLTHFEDHFWIACLSYFLDPNMCGFQFIWRVLWSQILVVNWQN